MVKHKITSSVGTHIGNVRENNEDNFYYNGIFLTEDNRDKPFILSEERKNNMQFYAVFDGMGGEAYGEIASYIAASTLLKYQTMLTEINYHSIDKYVDMYISESNNLICEASEKNGNVRIGTTMAMACIVDDIMHIYNIGDSRIYKIRNRVIEQLTEDHTQAMRAVKMGTMTPEQAKTHPHRNKLTQHLGISPAEMIVTPHCEKVGLKNNDIYLICSDGICDLMSDNEIKNILTQKKDVKALVIDITNHALAKGGKDNITAMVLKVTKVGLLF